MLVRSVALIACAVWVSAEIAISISEADWKRYFRYKPAAACLFSCLACCVAMGVMYWHAYSVLEDQRNDADAGLYIDFTIPAAYTDIKHSLVRTVNNGGIGIVGFTHVCIIRELKFDNGVVLKNHELIAEGLGAVSQFYLGPQTIGGHGKEDTSQCMNGLDWSHLAMVANAHVTCADVNVEVGYALSTQPLNHQWKTKRYVLKGDSQWKGQPEDGTEEWCSPNPPPESSLPFHFSITYTSPDYSSGQFTWFINRRQYSSVRMSKVEP